MHACLTAHTDHARRCSHALGVPLTAIAHTGNSTAQTLFPVDANLWPLLRAIVEACLSQLSCGKPTAGAQIGNADELLNPAPGTATGYGELLRASTAESSSRCGGNHWCHAGMLKKCIWSWKRARETTLRALVPVSHSFMSAEVLCRSACANTRCSVRPWSCICRTCLWQPLASRNASTRSGAALLADAALLLLSQLPNPPGGPCPLHLPSLRPVLPTHQPLRMRASVLPCWGFMLLQRSVWSRWQSDSALPDFAVELACREHLVDALWIHPEASAGWPKTCTAATVWSSYLPCDPQIRKMRPGGRSCARSCSRTALPAASGLRARCCST